MKVVGHAQGMKPSSFILHASSLLVNAFSRQQAECELARVPAHGGSAPRSRALQAVVLAALVAVSCARHESTLPKLFPVPDAPLVDEHAKPMNLAQLKGYVTVYDFIFTNCA